MTIEIKWSAIDDGRGEWIIMCDIEGKDEMNQEDVDEGPTRYHVRFKALRTLRVQCMT